MKLNIKSKKRLYKLFLSGVTQKDIAKKLGISAPTVNYHIGKFREQFKGDNINSATYTAMKEAIDEVVGELR